MASKASSSKEGEELVGQDLARSLWAQGLFEPEAWLKQAWLHAFFSLTAGSINGFLQISGMFHTNIDVNFIFCF